MTHFFIATTEGIMRPPAIFNGLLRPSVPAPWNYSEPHSCRSGSSVAMDEPAAKSENDGVPDCLDSHRSESFKPIPLIQNQYRGVKGYIDRARHSHPTYFALNQNYVGFVVAVLRAPRLSSETGNCSTTSQLQEMSGANLFAGLAIPSMVTAPPFKAT
jgi:hypothetical protein